MSNSNSPAALDAEPLLAFSFLPDAVRANVVQKANEADLIEVIAAVELKREVLLDHRLGAEQVGTDLQILDELLAVWSPLDESLFDLLPQGRGRKQR